MTPDVRDKVRKLRGKLCSLAEEYKGVCPKMCQTCASPCVHGRELLQILNIDREAAPKNAAVFEPVHHSRDRIAQKVIRAMNRRNK